MTSVGAEDVIAALSARSASVIAELLRQLALSEAQVALLKNQLGEVLNDAQRAGDRSTSTNA